MRQAARRARAVGVGLLLAWLLVGSSPASAGDPASPAAEAARRLKRLKSRASEWWQDRQRVTSVCSQCGGRGTVLFGRRGWVQCPKCDGRKRYVDPDRWRRMYYEMRTPAFRLQDGIRERLEEEFKKVRGGDWPTILKRHRIQGVEMPDSSHGVVHVEENDDRTARPQKWIWAEERGKGDWFLWEEGADGPWVVQPPPPPPKEAASPFLRVLEVTYDKTLPKESTLLWRLTVRVETPPTPQPVTMIPSGLWLDFLLAESKGAPEWKVISHAGGQTLLQVGGVLEHEMSPEVLALTPEQWQKDILVRLAPQDASPAPSVQPRPAEGSPEPSPRVQSPQLDRDESRALVETWGEEWRERKERVDALRGRLPELEGQPEKAERAKRFLDEADQWLVEARASAERLAADLEPEGATMPLAGRSTVNVLHFRVHRNLLMVTELLPAR